MDIDRVASAIEQLHAEEALTPDAILAHPALADLSTTDKVAVLEYIASHMHLLADEKELRRSIARAASAPIRELLDAERRRLDAAAEEDDSPAT